MTELHFMIALFERQGNKVEIQQDLFGYQIVVTNPSHQVAVFIFNHKAEFLEFYNTTL